MYMCTENTHVILPSNTVAVYLSDGQWEYRKPSLLQDLVNLFKEPKVVYLPIDVNSMVMTPDQRTWYCPDKHTLKECGYGIV